jgi:riboflavin-specific deaminase-like protein
VKAGPHPTPTGSTPSGSTIVTPVRQLLPEPREDVDPAALYVSDERPRPAGRPWVLLNMIASVDGATAVEGRSGALGGPADKAVFGALRSVADVIMVGAATVRAEHYGPPRTSAEDQAARQRRGQSAFPRIAIVTGRLDLDLTTALFTASPTRPIVVTAASAPPERRAEVAEVADVVVAGDDRVDFVTALGTFGAEGVDTVLCEGGPMINDQLLAADLIDEVAVTFGPWLVGGDSKRMITGPTPPGPVAMRLDRALADDSVLLLRYVRAT